MTAIGRERGAEKGMKFISGKAVKTGS